MTNQSIQIRRKSPLAVVLLAAGKGTRMQSDRPKAMHRLGGQPMIRQLLGSVETLSPDRIVVVIGPDMDDVADTVAPYVSVVQTERLGTGHAVLQARSVLKDFRGDVLVLFADTPLIMADTISGLINARIQGEGFNIAVLGFCLENPIGYGRLITDETGDLLGIIEEQDATEEQRGIKLCNSGAMVFEGNILFDLLEKISKDNAKGEYYLTDVISCARDEGKRCAVFEGSEEELHGVNSRADLARAESILQTRLRLRALSNGVTLQDPSTTWMSVDTRFGKDVTVGPNVFLGPGVDIGDRVEIRAFSHLEGVVVKADAMIGPFARLRPNAVVGERVRIGNFVEVKESEIESGAKINHLAYIGDARVGEGANIGAGTITCNYDGLSKHRTDIGANAFIGSNSALVAPVSIGDRAMVGAGSTITDDIEADALAVTRADQKTVKGGSARWRKRHSPGDD